MTRIVCKIGGTVLDDTTRVSTLLQELRHLIQEGTYCVIVHGGGKRLSTYSQLFHIEPRFDNLGRRITTSEEMKISDMVLAGLINKELVRLSHSIRLPAVGISCADNNIIVGTQIGTTHTGEIIQCNISLVEYLVEQGMLVVLSSVSSTAEGVPLNINADEVAKTIAESWNADTLLYLSDVKGIIDNGDIIPQLKGKDIDTLIAMDTIHGGMIIKATQARDATHNGVGKVIIGQYEHKHDLQKLISNKKGTHIVNI